MLNKLLKCVLDQDTAPVVVCDVNDIIIKSKRRKNYENCSNL